MTTTITITRYDNGATSARCENCKSLAMGMVQDALDFTKNHDCNWRYEPGK